jgi:hypothetical protein
MGEHTNIALEGERGKRGAQHLLGDPGISGRNPAIAIVCNTLPKKLDPYPVRVFHDVAYKPVLRMHTYRGQSLRIL